MFLPLLLLATASAAQAEGAPTAQTEMLGLSVPDEFVVGYQARNEKIQIVELVVSPETVETWSKLVTSQVMFNAAPLGLEGFYRRWREGLSRSCARMTDTVTRGNVDGAPALRARILCPKNPQTGKPENLDAILVRGKANLMIVQVAFRRPMTLADTELVAAVSASLKVCDERSLASCSARKAVGFLPLAQAAP